jgi:hypothetical protein
MEISNLSPVIFETIGVIGFGLYVLNYTLLTLRCLSGHDVVYFILNLLAAAFVLVGLVTSFNLASALIQIFWVAMLLVGIGLRFARPPHSTTVS